MIFCVKYTSTFYEIISLENNIHKKERFVMANVIVKENECMKKYSPSEKREIEKALEKLKTMITTEEQYGVPFEKIFNNESVKYDVFGKNFYTFKAHGRDKAQIRILYKFIRKSIKEFDLELHLVAIKRKNDKEYMKEFQRYVDCYA